MRTPIEFGLLYGRVKPEAVTEEETEKEMRDLAYTPEGKYGRAGSGFQTGNVLA